MLIYFEQLKIHLDPDLTCLINLFFSYLLQSQQGINSIECKQISLLKLLHDDKVVNNFLHAQTIAELIAIFNTVWNVKSGTTIQNIFYQVLELLQDWQISGGKYQSIYQIVIGGNLDLNCTIADFLTFAIKMVVVLFWFLTV